MKDKLKDQEERIFEDCVTDLSKLFEMQSNINFDLIISDKLKLMRVGSLGVSNN